METRTLPVTAVEPALDRLFRLSPQVYAEMVSHGLLPEGGKVAFVDGLLVDTETEQLYPLELDVYRAMVEQGLLTSEDKIELLDGFLVEKMTKGNPHENVTFMVRDALQALNVRGWHVRTESGIILMTGPKGRASVPEPDVSFARGTPRDYLTRGKPTLEDLAFIAEVADSSVRKDRARLPRYAWVKIPIVWIVNLVDLCVEVYANPSGPADPARYGLVEVYRAEDEVPVVIDGRLVGCIAVKEILP
jgi:Uma2 family endonuclease